MIAESDGAVREVRAVKDEQYLYLRLRLADEESWRKDPITIGIDLREGSNGGLPGHPGVFPDADVALVVGPEEAELLQAAWWEPTRIRYGLGSEYFDVDRADMERDSGVWVHPLQILNRPLKVPTTGETRPVELHEIASLPIGTGDPDADGFDQRTLVAARGQVVEVRLPWALLGFSDPSSLKLFVEHPTRETETTDALPIRAGIVAGDDPVLTTSPYTWEAWNAVTWHERRKAGFDDLGAAMRELSKPPGGG